MTEEFVDAEKQPVLKITFNVNGQPTNLMIGNQMSTLNISYDKYAHFRTLIVYFFCKTC